MQNELIFLKVGTKRVNIPVVNELSYGVSPLESLSAERASFNYVTVELNYDQRLGIRWGVHGNTTFYSAVR